MKTLVSTFAFSLLAVPAVAHGGNIAHAHPHGSEALIAAAGLAVCAAIIGFRVLKKVRS